MDETRHNSHCFPGFVYILELQPTYLMCILECLHLSVGAFYMYILVNNFRQILRTAFLLCLAFSVRPVRKVCSGARG